MGHVIVADGGMSGYAEGSLLTDNVAEAARSKGAVLLPVDVSLFGPGSIAGIGYSRRAWGGGYPMDSVSSKLHAPLVTYVHEGASEMHWALAVRFKGEPNGRVQVNIDSNQAGTGRFGMSHRNNPVVNLVELAREGKARPDGSWLIEGSAGLSVGSSGYAGIAIYGAGQEVNILWMAASLT